MRAIVQDSYGPVSNLRLADVPTPLAGPGEVQVRVHAASVHPDVWHVILGRPAVLRLMGAGVRRPRQPIPGTDFAGTITSLGANVSDLSVGDDVFGESLPSMQWVNGATYAEFVVVPPERLHRMPPGLSYAEAATLPTSGIIAIQSVREQGQVKTGDRVLVNGGAGGVGGLSLQIAKADGATVTGVDDTEHLDVLRALGADTVLDYRREDFTRSGSTYDIVIDIPGNRSFREIQRVLAADGTYVLVGHDQYGREGRRVLGSIPKFFRLMSRSPWTDQLPSLSFKSRPKQEYLKALYDLAEAGHLRPILDRTFPLEQAAAAIERLASGSPQGRVVLEISPEPPGRSPR